MYYQHHTDIIFSIELVKDVALKKCDGSQVHKPLKQTMKPAQLLASAVKELQFANIQVDFLLGILDELDTFTGTLEKVVIQNAKERHQINKLIHAKVIFNKQ